MKAVLTDIEGTTTPLAFVHEVLFPYARKRLEAACASGEPRYAVAIAQLQAEYEMEEEAGKPDFGNGAPYAAWLMDRDRKSTGLKLLQGILWFDGYHAGQLIARIYDDVPPALARWKEAGIRMRVFSSGSVQAQQLLFRFSNQGDLSHFFEGFHDTTTGPKQEPASYAAIARSFELAPSEILFLSDVLAELDAARAAGFATGLLLRPGNKPVEANSHPAYANFAQIR
jgi:enolase-phosphatase E1